MSQFLVRTLLIFTLICSGDASSQELYNIMSHPNWQLLNSDHCGLSNSDRIVGGIDSPIGAYPWLARIGYTNFKDMIPKLSFHCGAAVISEFYILTAAHCVVNIPSDLKPVIIRLGEHDIRTNPDCDHSVCNDPVKDHHIAKIVAHERYHTVLFNHDIALIRVKIPIAFTDFVRPICMLKGRLLGKNFSREIVEIAGWGVYNIMTPEKKPQILQTVKLPVLPLSQCIDNDYYEYYKIDSNQMCVGGKLNMDSCSGDSGGPVMKTLVDEEGNQPRYYVIAVVSYGPSLCGETNIPGVYTDVSKYTRWILDHLRA